MDDSQRQRQVREGAGLDEGRINQDFLDFVNKWGTWILLILLVGLGIYVVDQRMEQSRTRRINTAFSTLDEAREQGATPERLVSIASEFSGIRGVAAGARLQAADTYLQSVRRGLQPGVQAQPGQEPAPEDLLTDEDREFMLEQAERLYRQVIDETRASDGMEIHAINALFGLAAVAESRGNLEQAEASYREIIELAEANVLPVMGILASERIAMLPNLSQRPTLYAQSDLPQPPAPEATAPDEDLFGPAAPGGEAPIFPGPPIGEGDDAPPPAEGPPAGEAPAPEPEPAADEPAPVDPGGGGGGG